MAGPRTPREFADAGLVVRALCRCGHEKRVDPLMFEFTHGESFDLTRGILELSSQLYCEACGDRPAITFGEAEAGRRRA